MHNTGNQLIRNQCYTTACHIPYHVCNEPVINLRSVNRLRNSEKQEHLVWSNKRQKDIPITLNPQTRRWTQSAMWHLPASCIPITSQTSLWIQEMERIIILHGSIPQRNFISWKNYFSKGGHTSTRKHRYLGWGWGVCYKSHDNMIKHWHSI